MDKILTGKSKGKRPLGRPRRRWEDNIRMDLEEIGINAENWVDSAQDKDYWRALVNAALNLRVPLAMKLVSVFKYIQNKHVRKDKFDSHPQTHTDHHHNHHN